jgi:hypothetical protein
LSYNRINTFWNYYTVESVDVTVNHCKSVFTFFLSTWNSNQMYTVQWDYSGKWNTRKKCKNYIEYFCSVYDYSYGLQLKAKLC